MNSPRPAAPGKTRVCPHCKATILESASVCPGCHHHLRFDAAAAQRQLAARTALRVTGTIQQPGEDEAGEYVVMISVRNERGEEVTRHVVNVGALAPQERRTFTLSVDLMPAGAAVPKPPEPKPAVFKPPIFKPAGRG